MKDYERWLVRYAIFINDLEDTLRDEDWEEYLDSIDEDILFASVYRKKLRKYESKIQDDLKELDERLLKAVEKLQEIYPPAYKYFKKCFRELIPLFQAQRPTIFELDEAYELFESITKGIPYGKKLEARWYYNKCYLKLEEGDIRKSIHLSYFKLPHYPQGIITIDGGIKELLESEEDRKIVDRNKEVIEKALNGLVNLEPFGENGYVLIVGPEFSRREVAFLSVIIDRIIREKWLNRPLGI